MDYPNLKLRYCALLADGFVCFPFASTITMIGIRYSRLFEAWVLVPVAMVDVWNNVYRTRRDGASVGKRGCGLEVRRLDGEAIGYREALLRYAPRALAGVTWYYARVLGALAINEADYAAARDKERLLDDAMPDWTMTAALAITTWLCLNMIVTYLHPRRRALHDFIAGTVVVNSSSLPRRAPAVVPNIV